jgi:hypothetical protein
MLDAMKKSVMVIMGTIIKLNALFTKERGQLAKLEKALNLLGNPGFYFEDLKDFFKDDEDDDRFFYCLAFNKGHILVSKKGYQESSKRLINLTDDLPLRMIDAMIERLPIFLGLYQRYLEEEEIDHSLTFDKLSQIDAAITAIVNKK